MSWEDISKSTLRWDVSKTRLATFCENIYLVNPETEEIILSLDCPAWGGALSCFSSGGQHFPGIKLAVTALTKPALTNNTVVGGKKSNIKWNKPSNL